MRTRLLALMGGLLALCAVQPCVAKTAWPKTYADAKTRNIEGGRKVLVVLAAPQIGAGFQELTISPAALLLGLSGYKLGLNSINRARAEQAVPRVLPLRAALGAYDFNTRFYDAIVPTVQASNWVRGQDYERTGDASPENLERELNDSDTRQMLTVTGEYYVDHRAWQAVVVELTATILVRKIPKGQYSAARLKSTYIPFQQTFRSTTFLPGTEAQSKEEIIARWAADEGRDARRALELGIERVRTLFAENLDATESQVEAWHGRGRRMTVDRYGMMGWVVASESGAVRFTEARGHTLNYLQVLGAH